MDAKAVYTADEDDQVFEQIGLRLSLLVDRPARANQNGPLAPSSNVSQTDPPGGHRERALPLLAIF